MSRQSIFLGVILALGSIPGPSIGAATYVVDPFGTGDFPTIQAALDACVAGDEIELTNGVFKGEGNRDLDFRGKAILLHAQPCAARDCVLDCQGTEADPHRGFHFHSAEGPGSMVQGMTIRGGWATHGGGVWCEEGTAPSFLECGFFEHRAYSGAGAWVGGEASFAHCAFVGNAATWSGGGLEARGDTEIQNCTFRANAATHGAGLYLYWSSATVEACTFIDNDAGRSGGAAHCEMPSTPVFTRCTFASNVAGHIGGGLNVQVDCTPIVSGCTLAFNSAPCGGGMWAGPLCAVDLENTVIAFSEAGEAAVCLENETLFTCCDLFGNAGGDWVGDIGAQYGVNGNISADPLFCDPAAEDFRLEACSPCAPFSPPNPECGLIGAWPVGCGSTPAVSITWGGLKHAFR